MQSNRNDSREGSRPRKHIVTHNDAYIFTLRVAFLAYLLQPKARRMQHVPAPPTPPQRSTTSINDLMKDFSLWKDSKSTRFPHGFMSELDKRLTSVLMGKEKKPEYNDPAVKRTFAAFLNAFTEQSFKKRMEKDRRIEDLVLIFFSNATKELQKGKVPGEDSWKLMVDRHLALFLRLISLVLKDHDWVRDRPELFNRLSTLETKLLAHDQDLTASTSRSGATGGSTIEVIVPRSYEVKDMPLVLQVARIFGLTNTQVQSDINKHKSVWTEKAALKDLKSYQAYLNINSRRTLRSDDFDLDEGYEAWKKSEVQDLSQMMLTLIKSNPELAKSTAGPSIQQLHRTTSNSDTPDVVYPDASRSNNDTYDTSSYVIDQPVDMSTINSNNENPDPYRDEEAAFTFIPPDTRSYYRFILGQVLRYDLTNAEGIANEGSATTILSKQSAELLVEICLRWRIPQISRTVLFLDAVREKFVDQDITLDTLDAAFNLVKELSQYSQKSSNYIASLSVDRSQWTVIDNALNQQILLSLHDALLRDLYDAMQHCYEQKPPTIGPIMYVLENHIHEDPSFSRTADDLKGFSVQLDNGLHQKAHEMYRSFLEKEVPQDHNGWEFFHVIELGKAVVNIAQRIQKRYRKNPEIMGWVIRCYVFIY